mgnify:CR=1 FL=1
MVEAITMQEGTEATHYERRQRLHSGRELQALLGTIGFTVRGLFADYSGAGFNDAKSGKVITLTEAAAWPRRAPGRPSW